MTAAPGRWALVAEDERAMRDLIREALVTDGFEVSDAEDGRALLRLLEVGTAGGRRPDLLVTDVRMPRLSGLDAVALAHEATCDVPLVVITAFGDAATRAQARAVGALAVLDKPFDLDALRALAASLPPSRAERDRTTVPADWPCPHELGAPCAGQGGERHDSKRGPRA